MILLFIDFGNKIYERQAGNKLRDSDKTCYCEVITVWHVKVNYIKICELNKKK